MLAYGHEWNSQGQLPQTLREVSQIGRAHV